MPRFSRHAEKQMAKRRITHADVELALAHKVGQPGPGQSGSIWIRGYAAGGRILKVCVQATDQDYVITAAWPDE